MNVIYYATLKRSPLMIRGDLYVMSYRFLLPKHKTTCIYYVQLCESYISIVEMWQCGTCVLQILPTTTNIWSRLGVE